MKILFSIVLIFAGSFVNGQINFRTGDSNLDAELNVSNTEAERDLPLFKKNLTLEFGVSAPKIESLLKIMKPAEALLAIRISTISKKSLDLVMQTYKVNKDKGWGYIAKQMGIKPGSPEFHALKGKKKSGAKPKGGNGNGNGNAKGKK